MAKKKEAQNDDLMSFLNVSDPEPEEEQGGTGAKEPTADERIAQLVGVVDGLSKQVERVQDNFMQMLSAPQGPAAAPAPQPATPPVVSMEGLPDPVENPKEYATEVNKRVTGAVTAAVESNLQNLDAQQKAQAAQAGRGDALWNDFQAQYYPELKKGLPDEVDLGSLVETAARKVLTSAQRKGADVERYMYTTSDRFMQDVAEETRKIVSPMKRAEEGEGEDPTGPTPEEAAGHRTGGILGEQGLKGKGKATDDAVGPSLVDDITEVQSKLGYF
jgi:hypothetical protein